MPPPQSHTRSAALRSKSPQHTKGPQTAKPTRAVQLAHGGSPPMQFNRGTVQIIWRAKEGSEDGRWRPYEPGRHLRQRPPSHDGRAALTQRWSGGLAQLEAAQPEASAGAPLAFEAAASSFILSETHGIISTITVMSSR